MAGSQSPGAELRLESLTKASEPAAVVRLLQPSPASTPAGSTLPSPRGVRGPRSAGCPADLTVPAPRRQGAVPVGEVDEVAVRRPVDLPVLFVVARVVRRVASPGRSNGPTLNAFASSASQRRERMAEGAVWSAPQRRCWASGRFFSVSRPWRRTRGGVCRGRPPASRTEPVRVGFSSAASTAGNPLSEPIALGCRAPWARGGRDMCCCSSRSQIA